MSNAVADLDAGFLDGEEPAGPELSVLDGALARISPRSEVLRLLPNRTRRMVGAWCFADVFGPRPVDDEAAMHVPPHPHTGLQTVSWLVSGHVVHRDSLGSVAEVEPGRVAVMTAGSGIAHSEDVVVGGPALHGAQLWVALPDAERHRARAFTLHEPAPTFAADGLTVQVFVGSLGEVDGPAHGFTPLVGAELASPGGGAGTIPLDPSYEHLLVPLAGAGSVGDVSVGVGQALYLGSRRTRLDVGLAAGSVALLLGGEPFHEQIVMWWNFVARSHEEVVLAREQWNAGGDPRFGEVRSYPTDERLPAPPMPGLRLRPRGRLR